MACSILVFENMGYSSGFRVWGLGFKVCGVGFRVWGKVEFGVQESRVWGFGGTRSFLLLTTSGAKDPFTLSPMRAYAKTLEGYYIQDPISPKLSRELQFGSARVHCLGPRAGYFSN